MIQVTVTRDGQITNQGSFPSMEEAQAWTEYHQFPSECVSFEDVSEQLAQEQINADALAYLSSTDWMIIREWDGGPACPQQIKDLRATARLSIVR